MKYTVLTVFFFLFIAGAFAQTKEAADNRWKYIAYDINEANTNYYYDSETVKYISTNQVDVWLKIDSPSEQKLLHLEIACGSGMFHLMDNPVNIWGKKIKTKYTAGRWVVTPPNSEVYLLSKLICKNPIPSK